MTKWSKFGAVTCLVLLGQAASVRAPSAPDAWKVTVAPYLMGSREVRDARRYQLAVV